MKKDVRQWCEGAKVGCTECKKRLAQILVDYLEPIRNKRESISDGDIKDILKQGGEKARAVASETMGDVKRLVNLA
jgi:tryptophanyl-tRNA synthetase